MAVAANTPIELIDAVYGRLEARAALGRERLGRSLTFAEKILVNHLRDPEGQELERGRSYADLGTRRGYRLLCDGAHLAEAGAALVAETMLPYVQKLL